MANRNRDVLTAGLPGHALQAGDVGTIVYTFAEEAAYELEVVAPDGNTLAVVTARADQLHDVRHDELTHARQIGAD